MRLATYRQRNRRAVGAVVGQRMLDLEWAAKDLLNQHLPNEMVRFIAQGTAALATATAVIEAALPNADARFWFPLESVALLAPIERPSKNVFCVARNYRSHVIETARARGEAPRFPAVPEFFTKPPTAVVGHEEDVIWKTWVTQQLDYEVELGVVISASVTDLRPEEVAPHIFGYTIVNDISARDVQRAHGQLFKGKALDTTCPMGPVIVTADEFGDPTGHQLTLRVNGTVRQSGNTSDMLFPIETIISSLTVGLTLEPGDVIATGTPPGVALGMDPQAWLEGGDVIEAEIDRIGVLRNRVVRRDS